MLERIMKILSSLKLDTLVQCFLFIFLIVNTYWFIPGLTIILSPIFILSIIGINIKDFFKKVKNI